MSAPLRPFDLAARYVKLDDDGRGREVEVDPAFWAEIDARPDFSHGRLVMLAHFTADWPTWEIHPAGDELVVLLSGSMRFVLRLPDGEQVVTMQAGSSCLVPANTWHTAKVDAPCSALFITPCRGTRNAEKPD